MKKVLFAVAFMALLGANTTYASPQNVEADLEQGMCEASPLPTSAQDSDAEFNELLDGDTEARRLGYWHCTAYAEGHGHSLGYSYSDVHYSHAYNGAMRRCEASSGHHCHDVHCHYDHH